MTIQEEIQYERVVKQNRELQQEVRDWKERFNRLMCMPLVTGLYDKNDEPIRLGDILKETYKSDDGIREDYTVVEWHQPSASFVMVHTKWSDYTHFDDFDVVLSRMEVVGNKRYNPELLEMIDGYFE